MIEFKITRIDPESVTTNLSSMAFFNEALELGVEFISQAQILEGVRPYLKDPIGIQVVYSSSNTTGTPITGITITDHMGKLLMQLRRSDKCDQ